MQKAATGKRTAAEAVTLALDEAVALGMTVVRTWAFDAALHNTVGLNERSVQGYDIVIAEAAQLVQTCTLPYM